MGNRQGTPHPALEVGVESRDGVDGMSRELLIVLKQGVTSPWREEGDELLDGLIARGIAADPRSFEDEYRSALAAVLADARLDVPPDQRPILGARRGHHSEHLGHLLAQLQFLPRTYPDAKW